MPGSWGLELEAIDHKIALSIHAATAIMDDGTLGPEVTIPHDMKHVGADIHKARDAMAAIWRLVRKDLPNEHTPPNPRAPFYDHTLERIHLPPIDASGVLWTLEVTVDHSWRSGSSTGSMHPEFRYNPPVGSGDLGPFGPKSADGGEYTLRALKTIHDILELRNSCRPFVNLIWGGVRGNGRGGIMLRGNYHIWFESFLPNGPFQEHVKQTDIFSGFGSSAPASSDPAVVTKDLGVLQRTWCALDPQWTVAIDPVWFSALAITSHTHVSTGASSRFGEGGGGGGSGGGHSVSTATSAAGQAIAGGAASSERMGRRMTSADITPAQQRAFITQFAKDNPASTADQRAAALIEFRKAIMSGVRSSSPLRAVASGGVDAGPSAGPSAIIPSIGSSRSKDEPVLYCMKTLPPKEVLDHTLELLFNCTIHESLDMLTDRNAGPHAVNNIQHILKAAREVAVVPHWLEIETVRIAGAVGFMVFTILEACYGAYGNSVNAPITGVAKNLWAVMPKTSPLGLLNRTLQYAEIFNKIPFEEISRYWSCVADAVERQCVFLENAIGLNDQAIITYRLRPALELERAHTPNVNPSVLDNWNNDKRTLKYNHLATNWIHAIFSAFRTTENPDPYQGNKTAENLRNMLYWFSYSNLNTIPLGHPGPNPDLVKVEFRQVGRIRVCSENERWREFGQFLSDSADHLASSALFIRTPI